MDFWRKLARLKMFEQLQIHEFVKKDVLETIELNSPKWYLHLRRVKEQCLAKVFLDCILKEDK